jgi:hypothetical protein
MTEYRRKLRIEKNYEYINSARDLAEALATLSAEGLKPKQSGDNTYSIYGWMFGEDDEGYFFYRTFNQG